MEIWRFISEDNLSAADQLLDDIDEKCQLLLKHSEIGRARPEIGKEIRSFPIGKYLILYRMVPQGVEIVRVIHGARDLREIL